MLAGLASLGVLGAGLAHAEVRLPKLVGDNMVLQRNATIGLWGWADSGEQVRVAFHGETHTTRSGPDGRWAARMGPFAAGGPFEVIVQGANTITLKNILIGDVWVAAGQSNMEFPVANDGNFGGVEDADAVIAGAHYSQIRLFKLSHTIGLRPRQDVDAGAWTEATPTTVAGFSAIAYLFGRELHQRYSVPIGLIESAWGGTSIDAWIGEPQIDAAWIGEARVGEPWYSSLATSPSPPSRPAIEGLRISPDEATALADYKRYLIEKAQWYHRHGNEDRGRNADLYPWAVRDLNVRAWPTLLEPQSKAAPVLKGFDGTVWFRKEIDIPAEHAGKDLSLHLGTASQSDITFFNGEIVGETRGEDRVRNYLVPGKGVVAGRNVIAVRSTGNAGIVGLFADPSRFLAEIDGLSIPLAGAWSFQPGPDLTELPEPPALAKFQADPNVPTLIFNGMIAPLTSYGIKGVIWYQGETDARHNRASQYRALFPALIADWRRRWGSDFPFLFVQLAGWGRNEPQPAESAWAELREAQSMALSLPNTGMATAVDVGDEINLHPRNKQVVARRLSLAAAKVAYGEDVVHSGPTYQSMRISAAEIRIRFSNIGSGLWIKDEHGFARGFQIAGPDGKFVWAQARLDSGELVVSSEAIRHPVAVRYDWRNTPDGNVFNKEGLPAVPFRTDKSPQSPGG